MRLSWKSAAAVGVFVVLGGVLVKNVAAGPSSAPRASDVAAARRELKPSSGEDERAPLAPNGFVAGNGIVEPRERETKVAAQVPGRIARVVVNEGDFVEKGAVLVELESATEKAALDAAEGDVTVARATLVRTARGLRREDVEAAMREADAAKARSELSADSLARTEKLEKGGAATPDELDRARRQAEIDERTFNAADARRLAAERGGRSEDVWVAQAQLRASEARRDQARAAYERLTIRAPIDGTVLQVKLRAGEYYSPGGADPLVVMGDTRTLRVRMDVDERDVAKVKLGARAHAVLSAYGDRRFPGKVVDIGRRMGRKNVRTDDPTERIDVKILEVLIELEPSDGLVPGIRVVGYVEASQA